MSVDWLGYVAQKSPLDLWIYQEILVETKPDLIIETGKCLGGSALYLATICELIGAGRIVSIDLVEQEGRPQHPRLSYVAGSSVDTHVVETVKSGVRPGDRIMVILDSDHHCDHVLAELRAYADLVTPGCYLVVEDTIVSGNPVESAFGPGPMDAVDAFLATGADFAIDRTRERFLFTLNPKGYLRRIAR